MRSLRSFHLVLLLAIGAMALALFQQADEPVLPPRLEVLDHNQDGALSVGELEGAMANPAQFHHADQDRDGLLSSLEFHAVLDAAPVQR